MAQGNLRVFLAALMAAASVICLPLAAFADEPAEQETDIYGNVIEWAEEEYGDDVAGLEGSVSYSGEAETYSFSEQVEVLQQMESAAAETSVPDETGYVSISLKEQPEEWSQGNIRVTVWSGSRKHEIWLYRQSGWSAREALPVGTYTFQKAETASGDTAFSVEEGFGTFTISNNVPVTLELVTGVRAPVIDIPEEETEAETEAEAVEDTGISTVMILKIAIGVMAVLAVISGVVFFRMKRKPGYRNDILD